MMPSSDERRSERGRRTRSNTVAIDPSSRLALPIDRLATALLAKGNLDELLQSALEILADVARADAAILRVREGDVLEVRATWGLGDAVESDCGIPIEESLRAEIDPAGAGPLPVLVANDAPAFGEAIRHKGVRSLHAVPIANGTELHGVVYLGTLDERALADEDGRLLVALGRWVAVALVCRAEHEALGQAIRSRDEVLSVVAHDLKNPINVIALSANTLLQRATDSAGRRSIDRIVRSVQRADRLVRDLLEINAIETGQFSIERHRVEPADVILSALDSQQSLAAGASAILSADLSPELPPIEADEERLLEVLENLIGNAVKFTGLGGSIAVGAESIDGEVLIWVKDSGAGIAPEQLPHIFDRFWQARKTERRGTGLGLTICKAIVEAHGGRIWAESTVGLGTTVFFTMPCLPAHVRGDEDVPVANILLVDDRPDNLLALQAILERPQYRLVTATSGEEALSLALREQFAVALIDVSMPDMSGLEVAVHLKDLERSRDIPIIFITAFGNDPDEIHRAYSAGGADYLVKPLDAEIVRRKVAVFVDLSRRRHGADRRPRGSAPR